MHKLMGHVLACCAQDTMIIDHEVLEDGDFNQRQQVVRWVRRFPFR